MTRLLGIDPGSRHTGLVFRSIDRLLAWEIVTRQSQGWQPDEVYLTAVGRRVAYYAARADAVAIEGIRRPRPYLDGEPVKLIDPMSLIGTGMVMGACILIAPQAQRVMPRKAGRRGADAYPDPIKPASAAGTDHRRHARAAWDIAGALLTTSRKATR